MTYEYSERNQHDLLYEIARAYPGGIEALAARMGTTAKKLYKKLSPRSDERTTSAEEFSLIVEMCEGAGVLNATSPIEALCWRHGGVFIKFDDLHAESDDCILKAAAEAMAKVGSVAGAVNEALEAGEINDKQMEKIEPRMRKAQAALAAWWGRIKGRMKRDASKPRTPFFGKVKKLNSHDFESTPQ